MTNQNVHFFVGGAHGVGGVTSWATRMCHFLTGHPASVVGVNFHNAPNFAPAMTALDADPGVTPITYRPIVKTEPGYWVAGSSIVGMRPPRTYGELDREARNLIDRPAIYVPNYVDYGYVLAAIAHSRGTNAGTIGVCHTDEEHYYSLLRKYEPILSALVGVSERCARTLREMFPHRRDSIFCIPCGVDMNDQKRSGVPPSSDCIRLVYSGRFVVRQKRITDFIKLIDILKQRNLAFTFDLFGTGPDQEVFESYLDPVPPEVRVLDPRPHAEMLEQLANYEVILLPSAYEGTSLAMLEGMAAGLIPIVTRVSGAEDAIADGMNGYLVDVGDMAAMADCIERLQGDRPLMTSLGEAARETVSNRYRFEDRAADFEKVIDYVIKTPAPNPDAVKNVLSRAA